MPELRIGLIRVRHTHGPRLRLYRHSRTDLARLRLTRARDRATLDCRRGPEGRNRRGRSGRPQTKLLADAYHTRIGNSVPPRKLPVIEALIERNAEKRVALAHRIKLRAIVALSRRKRARDLRRCGWRSRTGCALDNGCTPMHRTPCRDGNESDDQDEIERETAHRNAQTAIIQPREAMARI